MSTRLTALVLIWLLPAFANAANNSNCDFTKLNFGINQSQLKKAFNLNTIDVATTGEGIIKTGAHEICSDLPENSMARLLLLDDNFVQLSIVGENTSGALLAFAIKTFDKQDNKKKPKKHATSLWNKKNQYSVMYNEYAEGTHNLERIIITSAKHQSMFEKQNAADDKDIDEEHQKKNKDKGKGKP